MIQSSSPPLTICFILGKNTALLMALRWPRKVRSSVGSIGMVEEVTTAANVNRVSGKCSFGKVHRGGAQSQGVAHCCSSSGPGGCARKVWISKTNIRVGDSTAVCGLSLSHVTKSPVQGVPLLRLPSFCCANALVAVFQFWCRFGPPPLKVDHPLQGSGRGRPTGNLFLRQPCGGSSASRRPQRCATCYTQLLQ